MPFIGAEPILAFSNHLLRCTVLKILNKQQYNDWLRNTGCRLAKMLICIKHSVRARELLKLSRKEVGRAICFLKGHCRLNRHLFIMDLVSDPLCRRCRGKKETSAHILCECEEPSAYRFEHLGRHLIEPWELKDILVRYMLNFASATGPNRPWVVVL